ncbi:MAG: OmpH family outer membrane protein [Bacteroidales bacterium]|nr:OmpH family outer membrane protein [Bacteroidales bacterium]
MKKYFLGLGVTALMFGSLLFTNCDKGESNNNQPANDNLFKIAYVMTDTLSEAYEYFNDLQSSLLIERQEKEAELSNRYQVLQNKFLKIQRDVQNRMMTPTTGQKKQEQLALQQQKLQQDQQMYEMEIMEKSQKMTLQILDSIQNYLSIYNKEHNYNMIITSDTLGSQILYADKEFDITKDVIDGLNKRYRASLGKSEVEEGTE